MLEVLKTLPERARSSLVAFPRTSSKEDANVGRWDIAAEGLPQASSRMLPRSRCCPASYHLRSLKNTLEQPPI